MTEGRRNGECPYEWHLTHKLAQLDPLGGRLQRNQVSLRGQRTKPGTGLTYRHLAGWVIDNFQVRLNVIYQDGDGLLAVVVI